jgi:uncharacterized protein YyaL (SSP411 family)
MTARLLPYLLALGTLAGLVRLSAAPAPKDELLDRLPAIFAAAEKQYDHLLTLAAKDPGIPRRFEGGKLVTVKPEDWTSGHFPGAVWYLYDYTRAPKWRGVAEDYTHRLERIRHFTGNHDIGFMLYCSYGNELRLTGSPAAKAVLLDGCAAAVKRYNAKVGAIMSWNPRKDKQWQYPVIIDNMMNLELLMWGSKNGGSAFYREVAFAHADKTNANHYRPDSSCYHVVSYDPETGAAARKNTHQGYADSSAWARGQSWGLYGYTMMYRETGKKEYLARAQSVADFLLQHPRLPADKIPYWDYDAPAIPNEPRDASAGAIMASALLELSGQVGGAKGAEYLAVARQQLLTLASPAFTAKLGENGGFILMNSVGHLPGKSEISVPLNYADYYYLEALLRYRAKRSK